MQMRNSRCSIDSVTSNHLCAICYNVVQFSGIYLVVILPCRIRRRTFVRWNVGHVNFTRFYSTERRRKNMGTYAIVLDWKKKIRGPAFFAALVPWKSRGQSDVARHVRRLARLPIVTPPPGNVAQAARVRPTYRG